jgi:hypothetical protein
MAWAVQQQVVLHDHHEDALVEAMIVHSSGWQLLHATEKDCSALGPSSQLETAAGVAERLCRLDPTSIQASAAASFGGRIGALAKTASTVDAHWH